ncbi:MULTISPECIES: hypothetical protein [unclassified Streptomyces]|uniref:hypothetical protein n=1 Tax=unclassified Streptomyces TaxID=2593676 RepID=UPI0036FD7931
MPAARHMLAATALAVIGITGAAAPGSAQDMGHRGLSSVAQAKKDPCAHAAESKIVRTYTRGPKIGPKLVVVLRCGSSTWGYRHLTKKGRWSTAFDRKIANTIQSGAITVDLPGQRIFDDVIKQCPPRSRFKVVTNPGKMGRKPHINPQGIVTAYINPNKIGVASKKC